MLGNVFKKIVGTSNDRRIRRMRSAVESVNVLEAEVSSLTNAQIAEKTAELRGRIPDSASKDELNKAFGEILPEAFALVREASKRATGMRHFDVQIIGAIVLHGGEVAEMKTGEGKTLVAVPALYLNALAGKGAHLVTVNDYLAARDAMWMGAVYKLLGLEIGVINSGQSYRVEWEDPEAASAGNMSVWVGGENPPLPGGKNASAVAAFKTKLAECSKNEAYACDVTYGTNNEFGFDYLRDNMGFSLEEYVQRGHFFAIVDEVDSILIDEARTPLIISGPSGGSTDIYNKIDRVVVNLSKDEDFSIDEKNRRAELFETGISKVESALGIQNLYDPSNLETLHCVNQSLRARHLYHRDVDYMVRDGKVVIVDEFTGRLMEGRRWSDGLHQAVEAKEKAEIEQENQTLATVTLQNYFRMYEKLSGMTGTADTEAFEFQKIYKLGVAVVPTHMDMVRRDFDDVIYRTEDEKNSAICEEIKELNEIGRPVLVGTTSIEQSEKISAHLQEEGITHQVLNAKNHAKEAEIVAQAGKKGSVTIATNMAGRGTDIVLGGNPEFTASEDMSFEQAQATAEANKKEVVELGGLHIIGSERHESRRIDNQLRGRSGRQGDAGSSRFYISLEDPLMRIFASDRVASVMDMVGWEEGVPMEHGMMTKVIESAQKKVESRNFDIRKHLLDYDDVLNTQREVVYKLRREILEGGEALKDNFLGIVKKLSHELLEEMSAATGEDSDAVKKEAQSIFNLGDREADAGGLERLITDRYSEKESEIGNAENVFEIQRFIMLQTIDALWKDHLLGMDHLREGISFRSYAQKNPLYEYKNEGFEMFSNLVATYEEEVCTKFFSIRLAREDDVPSLEPQRETQDVFLSSGGEAEAPPARQVSAPVRRTEEKVGRNDPCPCGSGKKYKKCCGV
ncbi:MAG: preprotein translocase subunit SecA [Candidatus Mycalebacterium zealandia]|nr:MAG: preprotein translocase subunit SecA [Candidatus Mycalebacterium zealandia]